jgi:hypothetical protein
MASIIHVICHLCLPLYGWEQYKTGNVLLYPSLFKADTIHIITFNHYTFSMQQGHCIVMLNKKALINKSYPIFTRTPLWAGISVVSFMLNCAGIDNKDL